MSRIPFIEARFFDADETQINIEHRLLNHQHKLRAARLISLKNNPDLEGADPDLLINEQTIRSIDGWLTTVCDDCRLRGR